ncbi:MAG TPA: hypothetical protein VGU63_13290 [Candidatus Acidoferrales bacterium]|nr:hypothetical protein [Candidatus Acidoferrales bacterium]
MRRMAEANFRVLAVAALAMGMGAAFAAVNVGAQEQSKYANETITVRTSAGNESLRVSSNGCSGTLSGPGTFVGMGDGCWMWSHTTDVPRGMRVRMTTSQISFEHDGKSYVIDDPATVKRARDLFGPLEEMFVKQNLLGEQQRALGERQREFGRQQREVKVKVPDMSADFQKVEADAKRLSSQGGTQSELGDLQSEIGDLQSRLGDLQSQAGDMQSKLGDQQSKLGDQQSALGDQQSALGDGSQKTASDVVSKLRVMLTQAIQSGVAKAGKSSDE